MTPRKSKKRRPKLWFFFYKLRHPVRHRRAMSWVKYLRRTGQI